MKLATLQDGSRDGQLVVVSRDLSTCHYATGIATRLQQALDDWNFIAPQLYDLSQQLGQGRARHAFPFNPQQCMAPLPRAPQWVDCAAYLRPNARADMSTDAQLGTEATSAHRTAQLPSDHFISPCAALEVPSADAQADFGAGWAVITGDITAGSNPEQALDGVRLLLLANHFYLRSTSDAPVATSFSPVAVTLDECGDAWQGGQLQLTLQTHWNKRSVGLCHTGQDMRLHMGQLLAQRCAQRGIAAGSIVGTGVLANAAQRTAPHDWARGYHSIADKRAMEQLQSGQASTAYLQHGDQLRSDMKAKDGQSLCGAIEHNVVMHNANHIVIHGGTDSATNDASNATTASNIVKAPKAKVAASAASAAL
jgi:fumarylacetoacetate (FAA) hydrolase